MENQQETDIVQLEEIDTINLSDDVDIPFQCFPCNENDMNNENPAIYTHILIPKQPDSLLFYPKVQINVPIENVKNKTIQKILLTLESEGIRTIENEETLKVFCAERTKEAFKDFQLSDLNTFLLNEQDVEILKEKKIKCYSCLNNFMVNETVVAHPSTENITIHSDHI
jgi:hypothetical protein